VMVQREQHEEVDATPVESEVPVRHLRTRFGPRQVSDLLQTIFAAEMVAPSRCLWIVSPWVSDVPVLDNRAGGFSTIAGDWPRARTRLAAVLAHLLYRGTTVVVATRPDEHNLEFLDRLALLGTDTGRLCVHRTHTLHEKGILGDGYYLSGSMNLTHNGISFHEEVLHFFTDAASVATSRQALSSRWGGIPTAGPTAAPSGTTGVGSRMGKPFASTAEGQ
jgi:hypothetical protein